MLHMRIIGVNNYHRSQYAYSDHLSITSEITSSHNTVVIGTYQQIVDAAIAESLEIPDELMNLAVERLKRSSIQFFVNQKLVCFKSASHPALKTQQSHTCR